MLGVSYVNTSSSATLEKGATVRLTVGARSGLVGMFNIGAAAAAAVAYVWDTLPSLKLGAVLSARPPGDATIATMDVRLSGATTPARILDAVSGIIPGAVVKDATVTRFELLTADAARETATDRGATARDAVTDAQEAEHDAGTLTGKLASGTRAVASGLASTLGVAEEVIVVGALAALGVALIIYGRPLLALLKGKAK